MPNKEDQKLGIVLPHQVFFRAPFFLTAVKSMQKAAADQGYSYANLSEQEVSEMTYDKPGFKKEDLRCQGLIFFCTHLAEKQDPCLQVLAEAGVPTVLVRRKTKVPSIITISDNDVKSARLVMDHLYSLGHRVIGFSRRRKNEGIKDRAKSYWDFLQEKGMPDSEKLVLEYGVGTVVKENALGITSRWLQGCKGAGCYPTAVFCDADTMAFSLIHYLRELGIAVPGDMAVAGFNNTGNSYELGSFLTGIEVPVEEMITLACEKLSDMLQGKTPEKMHYEVESKLVVRESCGAKKNKG